MEKLQIAALVAVSLSLVSIALVFTVQLRLQSDLSVLNDSLVELSERISSEQLRTQEQLLELNEEITTLSQMIDSMQADITSMQNKINSFDEKIASLEQAFGLRLGAVINLSDTSDSSESPSIAVSGSNVYVVWAERTNIVENKEIYLRTSSDNGASFGNRINLSNSALDSDYPEVAVSGNNLFVIWSEGGTDHRDVYFMTSYDNGATFGNTINLSNSTADSYQHRLTASGENIYVLWRDARGGSTFFRASSDNGATFGLPIRLAIDANPEMATFESRVFVVSACGPVYTVSEDNGLTFSEPIGLGPNSLCDLALGVTDMSIYSKVDAYLVWPYLTSTKNIELRLNQFDYNGHKSSAAVVLGNSTANALWSPEIAFSDGRVYIIWHTFDSERRYDILFTMSSDEGATFAPEINLSNNSGDSLLTKIAASGSDVYLLWIDNTLGNTDVYFRRSTDYGATFGNTINLTRNNPWDSSQPVMDLSGRHLYVVWLNETPDRNYDIYFRSLELLE